MKIQIIISYLLVLFTFSQGIAQKKFNPSSSQTFTLNSPFSAYDITNKGGSGVAEMGTKPYNQWKFEKVEPNIYRLKEVKSGKYLHIQNSKLEVGDIQSNWWSAHWELEHVSGNYYRIKCRWNKYGKPIYLQNPKRNLIIGELENKNAKYGRWRVRSVLAELLPDEPVTPIAVKLNATSYLRLINRSGYVAKMEVTYTLNGAQKSTSTGNLALNAEKMLSLPKGSYNVNVKLYKSDVVKWSAFKTIDLSGKTSFNNCYYVYGTVFNPQVNTDCTARPTTGFFKVFNESGYVFNVFYSYTVGGEKISNSTGNISLGNRKVVRIPDSAKNIRIKVEASTVISSKTIFNKTFSTPPNKCYKFYGTIFNPEWNNGCN